jgi:hypothetical protein
VHKTWRFTDTEAEGFCAARRGEQLVGLGRQPKDAGGLSAAEDHHSTPAPPRIVSRSPRWFEHSGDQPIAPTRHPLKERRRALRPTEQDIPDGGASHRAAKPPLHLVMNLDEAHG